MYDKARGAKGVVVERSTVSYALTSSGSKPGTQGEAGLVLTRTTKGENDKTSISQRVERVGSEKFLTQAEVIQRDEFWLYVYGSNDRYSVR